MAEAARLAAAELVDANDPQLRRLYADLIDLEARMTAEAVEPAEADDPRRRSDEQ